MPITSPIWSSPSGKHINDNYISPVFGVKRKADNSDESMHKVNSLYMVSILS